MSCCAAYFFFKLAFMLCCPHFSLYGSRVLEHEGVLVLE